MTSFRPRLEEIEGRITPASDAATVTLAGQVVGYEAGAAQFGLANPRFLADPSTQAISKQALDAVTPFDVWAITTLNQYVADLSILFQADPGTAPVVGPAVAQAQQEIQLALTTAGVAQALSNFVTAHPAVTPGQPAAAPASTAGSGTTATVGGTASGAAPVVPGSSTAGVGTGVATSTPTGVVDTGTSPTGTTPVTTTTTGTTTGGLGAVTTGTATGTGTTTVATTGTGTGSTTGPSPGNGISTI
jgi:hypothetical protein